MSVTISSQNYFFQKVIENGISKKDIVAQKDIKVIDTKKTEQHKKRSCAECRTYFDAGRG